MYNIYTKNNNHNNVEENGVMKNKVKKPDLNKYVDPTGEMSAGKFRFEIWLVKNKVTIYKTTVAVLVVFSILSWTFSLWKWVDYGVVGFWQDRDMQRSLAVFPNYTLWHNHFAPQPIAIVSAGTLSGSGKKIDVYAVLSNPNNRFAVTFDYYFVVNGAATPRNNTALLANEIRPVASLGFEGSSGGGAEVILENFAWKRISNHNVTNVEDWQKSRLNFLISSSTIVSPGSDEGNAGTAIRFNLTNDSPYGYRNARFYVALQKGESLYALMPLELLDFQTNETRAVDVRSYSADLIGSDILVYPLINIYNRQEYLQPPQ